MALIPKRKAKQRVKQKVFLNAPKRPRKKLSRVQLHKSFSPSLFTVLHLQSQTEFQTQGQTFFTTRIRRHGHADKILAELRTGILRDLLSYEGGLTILCDSLFAERIVVSKFTLTCRGCGGDATSEWQDHTVCDAC